MRTTGPITAKTKIGSSELRSAIAHTCRRQTTPSTFQTNIVQPPPVTSILQLMNLISSTPSVAPNQCFYPTTCKSIEVSVLLPRINAYLWTYWKLCVTPLRGHLISSFCQYKIVIMHKGYIPDSLLAQHIVKKHNSLGSCFSTANSLSENITCIDAKECHFLIATSKKALNCEKWMFK